MKIINTHDPGVLELRAEVLGCVVLIGLLFVAGGGLTIAFALDKIPIEAYFEPGLKNIALAVGSLGVLLGIIFMGGRSGKIFDRRQQTLTSWSGLFVPMRRKTKRLDGYSQVCLVKDIRRSNKSSTTVYPVRLEGSADDRLDIDSELDYLKSRRLAEALAKVLHWPLTDSTSGEDVIREADRLDESLRERMRRLGERVEVSPRPHSMRSQAQVTSSEVIVEIPGMSSKARLIMNLVVIIFMTGVGFSFFVGPLIMEGRGQLSENLPMLAFGVLGVMVPLLLILSKLRGFNRSLRVKANRVTLTVVDGPKTTEIPGDELEELSIAGKDINQLFQSQPDGSLVIDANHLDSQNGAEYTSKHGQPPTIPPALAGVVQSLGSLAPERLSILARSDRASVSFGGGLDSEELAYLYSAIMKVMVD